MQYMDTFVEQLVTIELTPKTKAVKAAIWVVAALLAVGLIVLTVFKPNIAFFLLIAAAALFFGAYYMCAQLNVEYEYIITNGEIDIDRIVNKRTRQRMANFTCSAIENIEKYNPRKHIPNAKGNQRVYYGCKPDESSVAITVRHPKSGVYTVVLALNDTFRDAIKKYVSYSLKSNL